MTTIDLIARACEHLGIDPLAHGLQIVNASELACQHFPRLDPGLPALIAPITNREMAAQCARVLRVAFPPSHTVTLIAARCDALPKVRCTLPLEQIARVEIDAKDAALYVPPLERAGSLYTLAEIVARLRAPDGCEWDRAQTRETMRGFMLEEAYEVVDAIERGDVPHVREELGDLLFHVFFQAQVASEANEFRLNDVARGISEKLVRRHPHVFGDVKVNGTEEILANWERIKESEKRQAESEKREAKGEKRGAQSETEDVPRAMPALMRAQKIAEKRKVRAGLREIAASVEKIARAKDKEKKLGEALFALAAYAAEKGIDAESALRKKT